LGSLTTLSIDGELRFGKSLATFSIAEACEKPIADHRVGAALGHAPHAPARAGLVGDLEIEVGLPVSFFQRSQPR
jgi:hypothetical protein